MKYSTEEFMQRLMAFEANLVENDFMQMFGAVKGADLWVAFKGKCSRNVTIFYRILDENERKQFHQYLEKSDW